MSKLAEQLKTIKVFNNWEILRQFGDAQDVAIEYHRPAEGRLGWSESCHTAVWSPRSNPHLEVPRGLKVGYTKRFHGKRSESYYAARNWAMETFGHDYVTSPFGGLIPKHVKAKAENAVKAATEHA